MTRRIEVSEGREAHRLQTQEQEAIEKPEQEQACDPGYLGRAHERELRAAERQADIEKVAAMEKALISVHAQSFPKAERVELPPVEEVDPVPIRATLEEKAGIPELIAATGGGEDPPVAASPEPVDRYALMREHRRRQRAGIPLWS